MVIALSILKVLGILLLVFVCILVMILLLPVIYEIDADLDHKRFEANIKWMFRLIRFRFAYHEKMEAVLSILFFQFDFLDSDKKKEREQKKAKKTAKKAAKAFRKREKEAVKRQKKAEKRKKEYYKNKDTAARPEAQHSAATQAITEKTEKTEKTGKISDTVHKVSGTAGKVSGTAKKIRQILGLVSQYDVVGIAGPKLIVFLKHIRPRILRGQVEFGLEDPAATGYITGGLAAIPFLYEFDLVIVPDFEADKNEISGKVYSRGHILLIHVVILVIRLIREKNIRQFISALRKTRKRNN